MQKIVTAPGGFGVMAIEVNDRRPTRDELTVRGDDASEKSNFGTILIVAAVGLIALVAAGSFFL